MKKVPKTKKVGLAGKFGPRYGFTLRKRFTEVEIKVRKSYPCPSCGAVKVKRLSTAIWRCRRCGTKFAGGAYTSSVVGAQARVSKAGV